MSKIVPPVRPPLPPVVPPARYREKRKNRTFHKTIRYVSRQAYAEVRPRYKGRFARKDELEAWAAEAAAAAAAAVAGDGLAAAVKVEAA